MSTKHTPGPWHVTDEGHVDSAFGAVAEIVGVNNPDDETMPNARLIAAAPDLLAALELCEGNISSLAAAHPNIYSEWLAVVSAAIAKATELQGSAK